MRNRQREPKTETPTIIDRQTYTEILSQTGSNDVVRQTNRRTLKRQTGRQRGEGCCHWRQPYSGFNVPLTAQGHQSRPRQRNRVRESYTHTYTHINTTHTHTHTPVSYTHLTLPTSSEV